MISSKVFLLFLIAVLCNTANCLKLPSYITRCRKADNNLNECALKEAIKVFPEILKGDKKYKLPNLMPLEIPEIVLEPGANLKIKLTDSKLYGLERAKITDIKIDTEKKHFSLTCDIDRLTFTGNYEINGRILVLPITGNGISNFTFVGGTYEYEFWYSLVPKNDKHYLSFDKQNLEYKTTRSYFTLDNLFNGDKTLGEGMNMFLNENWRDVNQELYPSLKQTISSIITSIISGYFSRIPYEEIYS